MTRLRLLENRLRDLGLIFEADICNSLLLKMAKSSNTQIDPYGNMSDAMSGIAMMNEQCDHNFGEDTCPACGKRLVE